MINLDCTDMKNADDLHALLAAALGFPAYYGHNLDALFDCLMDLRQDICLRLYGWAELGQWKDGFTEVFLDATRENPHLDIAFI